MALSVMYRKAVLRLAEWEDANAFQWLLLDDTYTPDTTAHDVVADVTTDELTDGSYSRVALTGGAITYVGSLAVFDAANPTFPALAGATDAAWLVCAYDTGADATDELVCALKVAWSPDGNDWTPALSASGVVRLGDGRANYLSAP